MSRNYEGITPELCEKVLLKQAIVFVKAMVRVQQVCDKPEVIEILLEALQEVKEIDIQTLRVNFENDTRRMTDELLRYG